MPNQNKTKTPGKMTPQFQRILLQNGRNIYAHSFIKWTKYL